MMTDPIADMLTRVRNALMAKHASLSLPNSKMKARIAKILLEEGYITDYEVTKDEQQGVLSITLKYDQADEPVIEGIKRVSRPGIRIYKGSNDIPQVRGGMGMAVVSTSKGVMSDASARANNVGGEVLCYVW